MSTFLEAVMALREAGRLALACAPERDIAHLPALPAAFDRLREAVHNPDLSDKALRALDDDRAREMARVELEATMEERQAVLRSLNPDAHGWLLQWITLGQHRKNVRLTPTIEPGPACSEHGDTVCKRREEALK